MYYNVLKAKDLAELDNDRLFRKEVLMQNNDSCFDIISIKKDEIIDTHTAEADAAVYVLDGEIEIHFDAQKFEVNKGELLMFKKMNNIKLLQKKIQNFS